MKSPAFQFYPTDFLADENVVLMSNQEVGCYVKLLCYCWREGSIPADVTKIARLCGEDGSAMADLWLAIKPCFVQHATDATRLVHPRLEEERTKQVEHRKERAESGAKGAKARWDKGSKRPAPHGSANGSAMQEPLANDGSSSSSSTSPSKKEEEEEEAPAPDDAPVPPTWFKHVEAAMGRPLGSEEYKGIEHLISAHSLDQGLVCAVFDEVAEKARQGIVKRPLSILRQDLADLGVAGVRTLADWRKRKATGKQEKAAPGPRPSPTAQRQSQGMATLARLHAEALAEEEAGD